MHVPAGLAYGSLTSLNPVNGIYTSFFTGITNILFGTGRNLSVGTYAVISLMVYSCISRLEQNYSLDSMDSLLMINNSTTTITNLKSLNSYTNETNLNSSLIFGGISNRDEDENYQLKLRISSSLAFWCGAFQVSLINRDEFLLNII
jgi:MFS superfamily sulfate permease-like transporter